MDAAEAATGPKIGKVPGVNSPPVKGFFLGNLNYEPQQNVMKKTMILIAGLVVLFTSVSAAVDDHRTARFGEETPAVVVEQQGSRISLDAYRGKWVVLSFWASTDPVSRMDQTRMVSMVSDDSTACDKSGNDAEIEFHTSAGNYTLGNNTQVEVLSVNLDKSPEMMAETVRLDNLQGSTQSRVASAADAERICKAFAMEKGLRTFVIDPEGRLVMADPDEASLRLLLSRS